MEEKTTWETKAEMLLNRIRKNRRRLLPWARAEQLTCFRVYDRDIPEIPLTVDWYNGRLHVASYERSKEAERTPAEWMKAVVRCLSDGLGIARRDIHVKRRTKGTGGTQYKPFSSTGKLVEVRENGLAFLVNLTDYIDTGLFLDHRITRRMVMGEARGKRFLNLFAYTGAFSVYAAAGGALSTTSVDLSNTYLGWAEQNMRANGFTGDNHRFVRDDILRTLEEGRMGGMFDLVVLDPPTISKSKAMARTLDIARDHVLLLSRLLTAVSPGGVVYFSNNFKRFKLRKDDISCRDIKDITEHTISPDFRQRFVHNCYRIVR